MTAKVRNPTHHKHSRIPRSKRTLHTAKLILLLPLLLYLLFIIPERMGVWDHVSGLDSVQEVADRFERSVGPDDAVPVRAGEKEFDPLIDLIKRYSAVKLRTDKAPQVVVRSQASVYDAQPLASGKLAQWTSPVTPIVVMYYDWPHVSFPEHVVPQDEFTVVGTLGNLHDWIGRSREDRHFLIVDLLLVGIVPLVIGLYAFLVELSYEKEK